MRILIFFNAILMLLITTVCFFKHMPPCNLWSGIGFGLSYGSSTTFWIYIAIQTLKY